MNLLRYLVIMFNWLLGLRSRGNITNRIHQRLASGIGLVIKNVNCPVSELEYVKMAGKRGVVIKGNVEFQF